MRWLAYAARMREARHFYRILFEESVVSPVRRWVDARRYRIEISDGLV
jgi:hypothetical protein